jgi:hypothetical protein
LYATCTYPKLLYSRDFTWRRPHAGAMTLELETTLTLGSTALFQRHLFSPPRNSIRQILQLPPAEIDEQKSSALNSQYLEKKKNNLFLKSTLVHRDPVATATRLLTFSPNTRDILRSWTMKPSLNPLVKNISKQLRNPPPNFFPSYP